MTVDRISENDVYKLHVHPSSIQSPPPQKYVVKHRNVIKGKKEMQNQAFCRDEPRSCLEVCWSIYQGFLTCKIFKHNIYSPP